MAGRIFSFGTIHKERKELWTAGIREKMIARGHALTARVIAQQISIYDSPDATPNVTPIFSGKTLDGISTRS
jgi:hypothetical protein